MKTVILAGGFGTRLQEETGVKPKPMVEIGARPILWHIMKIYAAHGFNEFNIALGYLGDVIKQFFLNYHHLRNDLTVNLKQGRVDVHANLGDDAIVMENWTVNLVDTGLHTLTGGRVKRMEAWLDGGTFMMTYGDGVADLNIADLVSFHRKHGKLATITAVKPPARFGILKLDGDQVTSFSEKTHVDEGWINGGFFVLEPGVLDYVDGDDTSFEQAPLTRLAADGELVAFRHEGFWQCMDTLRDVRALENLWRGGKAPWKVW